MPGDRRQILSLLRLPIPPLQRASSQQVSIAPNFPQGGFWAVFGRFESHDSQKQAVSGRQWGNSNTPSSNTLGFLPGFPELWAREPTSRLFQTQV